MRWQPCNIICQSMKNKKKTQVKWLARFCKFLQARPNQFYQLYQNSESNCYCDGINQWILTLLQFQTKLWFKGTEVWCSRHCRHFWHVVECRTLLYNMFISWLLKIIKKNWVTCHLSNKMQMWIFSSPTSDRLILKENGKVSFILILQGWLWCQAGWDVHRDTVGPDKQFNCCTVCRFLSVWQVRLLSVTLRWETK